MRHATLSIATAVLGDTQAASLEGRSIQLFPAAEIGQALRAACSSPLLLKIELKCALLLPQAPSSVAGGRK